MLSNRGGSLGSAAAIAAAGAAGAAGATSTSQFNLRTNHGSRPSAAHPALMWYVFTMVLIVLSVGLYIYVGSSNAVTGSAESLQTLRSGSTATTSNSRGFYSASEHVSEIHSELEYKSVLVDKSTPHAIVYYASWCGHCRRFAPVFISIAEKVSTRTAVLNAAAGPGQFPLIRFFAVDCVEQRSLCDQAKIGFYPSILMYNFPGHGGETKTLHGVETSIYTFLRTSVFQHGELDAQFSNAHVPSGAQAQSAILHNASLAFHQTAQTQRLQTSDILASLLFFFAQELRADITQEQNAVLRTIVRILLRTLPAAETEALAAMAEVHTALLRYSKVLLPAKKVSDAALRHVPWLSAENPALRKASRPFVSSRPLELADLRWRVCGLPFQPQDAESNRKSWERGHREAARGYSCGLWMLFHHLAQRADGLLLADVEAPVPPGNASRDAAVPLPAPLVQALVHDFVRHFFGCAACRAHFLHYYAQGWLGRGNVSSFADLQFWLLRLHNLVNTRIAYEGQLLSPLNATTSGEAGKNWAGAEFKQRVLLAARRATWPAVEACPQCYRLSWSQAEQYFLQHRSGGSNLTAESHEEFIRDLVEQLFDRPAALDYLAAVY